MRYYIIAGEASGDLHGSNLMKALMARDDHAVIRFWGGDMMAAVGGVCVRHIRDLAIMGFVEVVANLRTVLGNISFCKKDIQQFNPDAIIYIDYPGFNLKIAKWAHSNGYRNYHYISPQLWAWKKGRIKSMRRDLDALYYILPFEQDFYANNALPQAVFVGHPLIDAVGGFKSEALPVEGRYVVLMPGSRKQELKKMMPSMMRLARNHPDFHFVIAGMTLIDKSLYNGYIDSSLSNVSVVFDKAYPLLSKAYAAVVCSGTATLETALFNVPQVVCYRANALSIAIARWFVGRRISYISLVNLIAGREVVRELIQGDCNEQNIESEFQKIIAADGREAILKGYDDMRVALGGAGASARVAENIISNLDINKQ